MISIPPVIFLRAFLVLQFSCASFAGVASQREDVKPVFPSRHQRAVQASARLVSYQVNTANDPQYGAERNKDPMEERVERQQAKALIKDRHKALKKDTDKLLQLATELKQYVDKTDENILSLDVLKKSEEIEKLARSVKNKMKGY